MKFMRPTAQVKVGKELITNSQEAWLGYYVFALATLSVLGGGYLLLRQADLAGADYWLVLLGILILAAVCLGICIMCHILGHIVDALDAIQSASPQPDSPQPDSPQPDSSA
jgi:hypothetical protein